MRNSKGTHGLRAILASLLLLLLVGAATSLAQDENLYSQAPEIDQTPVVLSRTLMPDAVNIVVELPVRQDTYIASNQPSKNWCSSNWLRLGYSKDPPNNGAERIFLKFDLSSIPSDAAINSARFRIYQHSYTPPGDSQMKAESRHLLSDWSECLVTWNSHQPHWGAIFGSSWVPATVGWLEADATELVKDWVYGTHANYGAMIMGDENVRERQRMFYSREDTGGRYPRLIVDYTLQVDTQPPQVSVDPLPPWSRQRFTVSWSGTDPGGSGIDYYDVQYRRAKHTWNDWLLHTRSTSSDFVGAANGTTYEFRARGVDKAGNVQPWSLAQAWTTVDSIPPAATADPLDDPMLSSAFQVSWSGSDNTGGSGIKNFDVQYQEDGGPWQYWQVGTTALSALATGTEEGVRYGVRVRATDNAGNVQPWSPVAQAETTVYLGGPVAWVLPFNPPKITDVNQSDFLVRWDGEAPPGTNITGYDIRYSYQNGSWIQWKTQTQLTQDTFADLRPEDGSYCFQARATDSSGKTGDWNTSTQQCMIVDKYEPFLEPIAYLPLISTESEP